MPDYSEPAFPVHGGADPINDDPRNHTLGGGMTLRDYYAAKAMAALIGLSSSSDYARHPRIAADRAFQFADAMLAHRDRSK